MYRAREKSGSSVPMRSSCSAVKEGPRFKAYTLPNAAAVAGRRGARALASERLSLGHL